MQNQCFLIEKKEETGFAKAILNSFCNQEHFGEIVLDVFIDDGGYIFDEVPGIAVWGKDSEEDLIEGFGFKKFDGVRSFYDYSDGYVATYETNSFEEFMPLLKQAILCSAELFQHRKDFLNEVLVQLENKYRAYF